jgi:hypothetical protein
MSAFDAFENPLLAAAPFVAAPLLNLERSRSFAGHGNLCAHIITSACLSISCRHAA